MAEVGRLPADCTADDIVEASERDGGVIVDGWLSPDLLGYALYDASSVGGGYLGYHDMGDPMRLLED